MEQRLGGYWADRWGCCHSPFRFCVLIFEATWQCGKSPGTGLPVSPWPHGSRVTGTGPYCAGGSRVSFRRS